MDRRQIPDCLRDALAPAGFMQFRSAGGYRQVAWTYHPDRRSICFHSLCTKDMSPSGVTCGQSSLSPSLSFPQALQASIKSHQQSLTPNRPSLKQIPSMTGHDSQAHNACRAGNLVLQPPFQVAFSLKEVPQFRAQTVIPDTKCEAAL